MSYSTTHRSGGCTTLEVCGFVWLRTECPVLPPPADLDTQEELDRKRICRIITRDFPQYFAVVSRVKQDSHLIGPEGGVLSSSVVPQVQAVFPEGALTKRIRVGLQVSVCHSDVRRSDITSCDYVLLLTSSFGHRRSP